MITVDLTHRGKSTITSIDLFDECEFGADKLRIRGTFATLWECAYQIAFALADIDTLKNLQKTHTKYITKTDFSEDECKRFGGGNPMEQNAEYGIALNRFNVPEKKFWENRIPSETYPSHADYCVQFILRVQFYKDFGYIHLGLPWKDDRTDPIILSELRLLKCCNISPEDAKSIIDFMIAEASAN